MPRSAPRPNASALPRRFGDFELLGEAGRGGMGIVFRARQMTLRRTVAVKMLLYGAFTRDSFVQRFRREATAAAQLRHPNIVPVHEVGEEEGQPYFVMDFIEGENLDDFVHTHSLSAKAVARMIKGVAEAVQHAHDRGIVHRDLKPANVVIDAQAEPHITDFGLAKRLDDAEAVTLTGAALGTPAFMAPEQLSGRTELTGRLSDVWAIGALLYFCLTKHYPFQGLTIEETLRQISDEDPAPARAVAATTPKDLETICLKCLEKEPTRRYGSAGAVAEELARYLCDEPILARPANSIEKVARWCRRRPALAGTLLALFLVLTAGLAAVSWQWHEAQARAREALAAAAQSRDQARRANIASARAERRTRDAGARSRALKVLREAAHNGPSAEVRDELIATLALTDLHFTTQLTNVDLIGKALYSPDLLRFAAVQEDGSVDLRTAKDHQPLRLLPAAGRAISGLRFSRTGHWLGGTYWKGSNTVWNTDAGDAHFLWEPGWSVVDFTPDDGSLLLARENGFFSRIDLSSKATVWATNTGQIFWSLRCSPGGTQAAAILIQQRNGQIRSTENGLLLSELAWPAQAQCLAWSPDGTHLWAGLADGSIHVSEISNGQSRLFPHLHDGSVVALGFSHDERWLATQSWDGSVRLWELPELDLAVVARGYSMPYQMSFSPDSRRLAFAVDKRESGIFEITRSQIFERWPLPASANAWTVDVSPDGSWLAVADERAVTLVRTEDGKANHAQPLENVRSVLFTPDAKGLVTCGANGIVLWSLKISNSVARLEKARVIREGLLFHYGALSSNGNWIAAANYGAGSIALYDLQSPTNRFGMTNHPGISRVALSPDNKLAASGTWNGHDVIVWDVTRRTKAQRLRTVKGASVVFSPDNATLMTGGDAYRAWDVNSWRELWNDADVIQNVGVTSISPDSQVTALVTGDHRIRLRETRSGALLANLESPRLVPLSCLRFSPDGNRLYALEWNGAIQVWSLIDIRRELTSSNLDWEHHASQ